MTAVRKQTNLFGESSAVATISAIVPVASDPNMRRISVGRKTVASLRVCDVEQLGLKPGMPWNARLAAKIEHIVARIKAHTMAMSMLGRRAYSRRELLDRLAKKGHDQAVIIAVADELAAAGWLNDAVYAEAIARNVTRTKPASKRLLTETLKARKIDDDLAGVVADQATAGTDEFDTALGLARNCLHTMGGLPVETIVRRLAALLARRGYDQDIVSSVIDRLKLGDHD